ncbi:MAG: hypothetical protein M1562_02710 [Candidatus Marsarchaeota archaeon]|jgi:hypothetical protein|nr:hypothetical protein [Candidatus Marsarchaeota archaeon]
MEVSKSRTSDNRNMLRTEGKSDRRIRKYVAAGSAVLGAALLAGCVSSGWQGPVSYTSNETMAVQRTVYGTDAGAQRVNIKLNSIGAVGGQALTQNMNTIQGNATSVKSKDSCVVTATKLEELRVTIGAVTISMFAFVFGIWFFESRREKRDKRKNDEESLE